MKLKLLATLSLYLFTLLAQAADVNSVRMWPAPDNTRVVFDISQPMEHNVFRMSNPDRVVIDIKQAQANDKLTLSHGDDSIVRRMRYASRNKNGLRIVLDLKEAVKISSFLLEPNREYGHRLVIDLQHKRPEPEAVVVKSADEEPAGKPREVIIAVDAGHGGEDPGARGARGTNEKDVVLAIAKKLQRRINAERGMRAIMIREGDYFVGLRARKDKARNMKADLFISIHADAFTDQRVRGSSVYVLSQRGASSEAARWLAEQENSSDHIGGVELDDKDDLLRSVLLDLSQSATLEASIDIGDKVLGGFKKLGKVHKKQVQHAGFAVLKSPDIPSVLVETAFISNPDEERKLKNEQHQERLASAMLQGIRSYFHDHAPPGTLLAMREHRIKAGETLGMIAQRYQVSTRILKKENRLPDDNVRAGDTLRIPWSDS